VEEPFKARPARSRSKARRTSAQINPTSIPASVESS
jgi:hypothetical protein